MGYKATSSKSAEPKTEQAEGKGAHQCWRQQAEMSEDLPLVRGELPDIAVKGILIKQ